MTLSEALRLVHLFSEYWPSAEMGEESAALWAKEIQRFDPEDVMEAAVLLGEHRQWMPSLAEFLTGIKECRRDRLGETARILPEVSDAVTFSQFLHDNPEWAERVKKLSEVPDGMRADELVIPPALSHIIKAGL